MNNFKIKMLISFLGGVLFSFIFILLALLVPINDDKETLLILDKPKGKLAEISHAMKNR
ncbi:hypothetical protein KKA17_02305 [bacterium]|nr:hypothetical protein [bacterium]MBU1884829.1 hypothetical protein [bacterium]